MAFWQIRIWIGAQEPLVLRGLPNGPSSFDRQQPGGYRFSGNTPGRGTEVTRGSIPSQFQYAIEGLENERQRSILRDLLIRQNPSQELVDAGMVPELGNINFEDVTQRISIREIVGIGSRVIVPDSAVDIDGNAITDADLPATPAAAIAETRIINAHFRSKCLIVPEDSIETLAGYENVNYSRVRFNIIELIT